MPPQLRSLYLIICCLSLCRCYIHIIKFNCDINIIIRLLFQLGQKNNCLKCRKLFQGNSMLIRLLFIQRNTINSNYFLAISKNRYWKLKLDIPNPITIFSSFWKYINTLNKCLHKLFLFSIRTFCI
jgi:hypothetical protein